MVFEDKPLIKTPNYYTEKDYPSLPFEGWLKPCYYRGCRMITANRLHYKFERIPCCRKCIQRRDALSYFIRHMKLE